MTIWIGGHYIEHCPPDFAGSYTNSDQYYQTYTDATRLGRQCGLDFGADALLKNDVGTRKASTMCRWKTWSISYPHAASLSKLLHITIFLASFEQS